MDRRWFLRWSFGACFGLIGLSVLTKKGLVKYTVIHEFDDLGAYILNQGKWLNIGEFKRINKYFTDEGKMVEQKVSYSANTFVSEIRFRDLLSYQEWEESLAQHRVYKRSELRRVGVRSKRFLT